MAHKCSNCEKEFSRKDHLKEHEDSVHKGIKHKCAKCLKEFSTASSLKRHNKTCTPDLQHRLPTLTPSPQKRNRLENESTLDVEVEQMVEDIGLIGELTTSSNDENYAANTGFEVEPNDEINLVNESTFLTDESASNLKVRLLTNKIMSVRHIIETVEGESIQLNGSISELITLGYIPKPKSPLPSISIGKLSTSPPQLQFTMPDKFVYIREEPKTSGGIRCSIVRNTITTMPPKINNSGICTKPL